MFLRCYWVQIQLDQTSVSSNTASCLTQWGLWDQQTGDRDQGHTLILPSSIGFQRFIASECRDLLQSPWPPAIDLLLLHEPCPDSHICPWPSLFVYLSKKKVFLFTCLQTIAHQLHWVILSSEREEKFFLSPFLQLPVIFIKKNINCIWFIELYE